MKHASISLYKVKLKLLATAHQLSSDFHSDTQVSYTSIKCPLKSVPGI